MTLSALLPVHQHPNALDSLTPILLPYLPYSFPLLRRLQFKTASTHAHVLCTVPPTQSSSNAPFTAAHVDRSRAPETECWLFCSLEPQLPATATFSDVEHDDTAKLARQQIFSILHSIASLPPISNASTTPPNSTQIIVIGSLSERLIPILAGNAIDSLGTSHVLRRASLSPTTGATTALTIEEAQWANLLTGTSIPYIKYLISPPSPSLSATQSDPLLPANYTFTPSIPTSDLPLVIASTEIPRSVHTLAALASVGVRYHPSFESTTSAESSQPELKSEEDGGELIAWAFLAPDGSLASLHVQPAHRGRGIAKAVCRRLGERVRDQDDEKGWGMGFAPVPAAALAVVSAMEGASGEEQVGEKEEEWKEWEDMRAVRAEGWMSGDAAEENEGSRGVMKSVGGKDGWRVRWVGVDMEEVRKVGEVVGTA